MHVHSALTQARSTHTLHWKQSCIEQPCSSQRRKNKALSQCRSWSVHQSDRVLPFLHPEKQWTEDEAYVDVELRRDSICHAVMSARVEADPHTIFKIFERPDYDAMFEIFKRVRLHEVIKDNGIGQKEIDLEFDAQWSFWKVSGTCFIPIAMHLDKSTGKIAFHQKQPGFLTMYEGCWSIMALSNQGVVLDPEDFPWFINGYENRIEKADDASLLSLELTVQPSIKPPPPIDKLLKGNTSGQVESLFRDLKIQVKKDSGLDVDSILRGQF